MEEIQDIAYAPEHGIRGLGDLYLPDRREAAPVALCIHGGGWNAMDKYSWSGVAQMMCEQGFAAFNINYRLLEAAPWPACGDDCLRAAEFLIEAAHPAMRPLDRASGVVVIGGSAGGHLALMTGLRLTKGKARAIVSVAGPADLTLNDWMVGAGSATRERRERALAFFGCKETPEITERMLLEASPVSYVKPGGPAVLCVHSTNDKLVPIEQSRRMVEMVRGVGCRGELFAYAGPGEQHGIWIDGSDPHRLLDEPANAIANFLKSV